MSQNALNMEGIPELEQKESGNNRLGKTLKSFKEMAFIVMDNETKAKLKALGIKELPKNIGEKNIDRFIEIIKKHQLWMKNIGKLKESSARYYDIKFSFDIIKNNTNELLDLYDKLPTNRYDLIYLTLQRICILENDFDINYQNVFKLIELFNENYSSISGDSGYINKLFGRLQNQESKDKGVFNKLILLLLKSGNSVSGYCMEILQRINILRKKSGEEWNIILKLASPDKKLSTIRPSSGTVKYLIKKFPEQEENIFKGLDKLGNDFVYVIRHDSGFLYHILERYPNRFVENCENLKKLADFSGENRRDFYWKCLSNITQFIVNHPDRWDLLFAVGKIFGEYSFNIFGNGISYLNKVLEKYGDNYEEFLQKTLELGKGFKNGNDANFFGRGLSFLSQFLDEGEEKFFENGKKLQNIINEHIKNWSYIFFGSTSYPNTSGLDFISKYLIYYPKQFEQITERVAKLTIKFIPKDLNLKDERNWDTYFEGMNQLISYNVLNVDPSILDELLNFYNKVGNRKDDIQTINSMTEVSKNYIITFILAYLLKHKKTKIIPFIKNLNLIEDLGLKFRDFEKIFLGGKPLEYLEESELQELFTGENVEQTRIYKNFKKLGLESHIKANEVKSQIQSLLVKNGKKFDKNKVLSTLIKLQNVFADLILANFEKTTQRKIHIKFKAEFKVKEFDDSLINEDLLEFYKMYKATRKNKKEAYRLIHNYLEGKVYNSTGDILKEYPYSRRENKDFLKETLGNKKQVWLSRNQQEFEVENTEQKKENSNIQDRINHHLEVANAILEDLEIGKRFNDTGKLINYFDTKLKREEENIEKSIFSDLKFQIDEIKKLLKTNKSRKVSKIKIYHELNPLKKAMMGNWVDGSCLSFYSSVGNYWSAITNALEVNKGVFYIEDEAGNVIARVLVCLDDKGALDIHPMYFKGNIEVDLGKYFNKYIKKMALKLGKNIDGARSGIDLLFCEDWYNGD